MKLHKASFVKALVNAANIHGHNVANPKKCPEALSWTDTMYNTLRQACKHFNANKDRPNRPCPKWMEEFFTCPGELNRPDADIFDRASEVNSDGDEHGKSEEQEGDEEESSASDGEEEEKENADGDKEEGDEEVEEADDDKSAVSKKPAAVVCKRPASQAAATKAPESSEVEYSYGFDVEKSLGTRRERKAPRSVPDELAVSMKEPNNAKDSDAMIGVFRDGSEVECAQYTVAMYRGMIAVAKPKKMPTGGRKSAFKFFKKEWQDGTLEVALKDNNYKGKPPQKLVLLRGPSGQIIQLDCKYWLVDKTLTWEHSDDSKRKHAESEAVKWMTEVAEGLHEGKLNLASVHDRKKDFILQHPASSVPAKKMPKKRAAPKPVDGATAEGARAETADDAEEKRSKEAGEDKPANAADDTKKKTPEEVVKDKTATTDGAKQVPALEIVPRQKKMPRREGPSTSTPPPTRKRSPSPPGGAPAHKRPTIAPPDSSSDTNLD